MPPVTLEWLLEWLGWDAPPPTRPGVWRRIWPKLRVAPVLLCIVTLIGGKLADLARLLPHVPLVTAAWVSVGVLVAFAALESALQRLHWIDKDEPARPRVDLAQVPPPPVPPPLADPEPRPEAASSAAAKAGGALPARLGGAAWGFEGGYVWRPEGSDEG